METLGQLLKREREFRGITLEELSKVTKINLTFLQKIEEDRFAELPKGAFVKGFLKSYVNQVGLNLNDVLVRYESLKVGAKIIDDPFEKPRRFEVKNQTLLLILFLVGVIILATFLSSR